MKQIQRVLLVAVSFLCGVATTAVAVALTGGTERHATVAAEIRSMHFILAQTTGVTVVSSTARTEVLTSEEVADLIAILETASLALDASEPPSLRVPAILFHDPNGTVERVTVSMNTENTYYWRGIPLRSETLDRLLANRLRR